MAGQGQEHLDLTGLMDAGVQMTRSTEERLDRLEANAPAAAFWTSIAIPAILSATTAAVAGIWGYWVTQQHEITQQEQTKQVRAEQRGETNRALLAAEHQSSLDNGRAALTLYFDKLGDIRTKEKLTPAELNRFVSDMRLIAAVSGNDTVRDILFQRYSDVARIITPRAGGDDTAPTPVVPPDAPSLTSAPASGDYAPTQFVAFPQAPVGRADADVAALTNALTKMGFNVQATQRIAADRSPDRNESVIIVPISRPLPPRPRPRWRGSYARRFVLAR